MSTEITTTNNSQLEIFQAEEKALISQMGLSHIPVPHIKAFLHTAKAMRLDPLLKRDISLIERGGKNGKTYTVQVGIAGYRKAARAIAKAEGESIKVDPWLFRGKSGDWSDFWYPTQSEPYPLAAKATVYRNGEPFTQVVLWDEFAQMKEGNKPQALWGSKPSYMLGKTAESLAWRQAFPDEMGQSYEESEVEAMNVALSGRVSARVKPSLEEAVSKPQKTGGLEQALVAVEKAMSVEALEGIYAHAETLGFSEEDLQDLASACADKKAELEGEAQ